MPITKQVIKRVKQAKKAHDRNVHFKHDMKSLVKLAQGYIEQGELEKANKLMPKVVKAIDNCSKKNIIHKNNAARKKSGLQKLLNSLQKGELKPKAAAKTTGKKAAKPSKAAKAEEKSEKKEEAKA